MNKKILSLLVMFSVISSLYSQNLLYVGVLKKKFLPVFRIDEKTGKLKPLWKLPMSSAPGFLAYNDKTGKIYALPRRPAEIMTFEVNKKTGVTSIVNSIKTERGLCYLTMDSAKKFLFAANYGNGEILVYPLDKNGIPAEKHALKIITPKKAHCIAFGHKEKFAYSPHTGPNKIFQFSFDKSSGKLTPMEPAWIEASADSEPRHGIMHPTLDIIYISNEKNMTASAYSINQKTGQLRLLQTIPTIINKFEDRKSTSDIKITPDGKFLYVANRGPNSIACIELDKQGKMKMIKPVKTGDTPRFMLIDPTGRFLYSACMGSNDVWSYLIDQKTGLLKKTGNHPIGAPGFGLIIVK